MSGTCSVYGGNEKCLKILVWEPEGKIPIRKKCRWKDIINTCIKEIWCEIAEWIQVAQDRVQEPEYLSQ
jgi:hypothetical protein